MFLDLKAGSLGVADTSPLHLTQYCFSKRKGEGSIANQGFSRRGQEGGHLSTSVSE